MILPAPTTHSLITPMSILTRLERLLAALAILLACAAVGIFLFVTLSRIGYPFELEWMEGASVDTAARLLDGQPIYTAPSSDWVSPIYGPVYYFLGAAAMNLMGVGFLPMRLISWVAALGSMFVLFRWVTRETGSRTSGFLAVALFAGTFAISESWLDLARVDTLFAFLLLAGTYALRFATRPRGLVIAGVCLALSFLTKQPALIPIIVFSGYALLAHRRRSLWFFLPLLLVSGSVTLFFEITSEGWYSLYVFRLGNEGAYVIERLVTFWSEDMQPALIALVCAVAYVAYLVQAARTKEAGFFVLLLLAMVAVAFLSRLRAGGAPNVLIPLHIVLVLMAALVFGSVQKLCGSNAQALRIGVLAACCAQFVALVYLPFDHLPTAEDRQAGEAFIELLEAQSGEVLVIAHGHYAEMAGRGGSRIGWSMNIVGAGGDDAEFITSMTADIERQRWGAIIVDWAVFLNEPYQDVLDRYYEANPIAFESTDAFVPVTGMGTRPMLIYTPRQMAG